MTELKKIYRVIDGKQRFNAIFQFLGNQFPLQIDGHDYFFNDLDTDAQREILFCYPIFDVHYSWHDDKITDETLIDIFEQVNFLGTPQDIEHLNALKGQ